MQSAVFDIETSSLEAVGGGILLCACVRPLSARRTRQFRIDAYEYDASDEHGFFERKEARNTPGFLLVHIQEVL